jgi:hypothetical protein
MRSGFTILLIVAILFGTGYWYFEVSAVCRAPIAYRIGSIDSSFEITVAEARATASIAESLWEDATGRNLFTYDEAAKFPINFVFDERQKAADEEEQLREVLEEREGLSDSVKEKYERLLDDYEDLKTSYEQRTTAYDEKLQAHNREVERWNEAGGAPEDIYENLEAHQRELSDEQNELNTIAYQLNQLVRQMNAIGAQGNSIITDYNEIVEEYNSRFAEHREFTQGDYQGTAINIYQFDSEEDLAIVLAHEFGHALSLGHVEGENSFMYTVMGEQTLEEGPTQFDLAEFERVCGERSFGGIVSSYFLP